jgi:hypothetical protein
MLYSKNLEDICKLFCNSHLIAKIAIVILLIVFIIFLYYLYIIILKILSREIEFLSIIKMNLRKIIFGILLFTIFTVLVSICSNKRKESRILSLPNSFYDTSKRININDTDKLHPERTSTKSIDTDAKNNDSTKSEDKKIGKITRKSEKNVEKKTEGVFDYLTPHK